MSGKTSARRAPVFLSKQNRDFSCLAPALVVAHSSGTFASGASATDSKTTSAVAIGKIFIKWGSGGAVLGKSFELSSRQIRFRVPTSTRRRSSTTVSRRHCEFDTQISVYVPWRVFEPLPTKEKVAFNRKAGASGERMSENRRARSMSACARVWISALDKFRFRDSRANVAGADVARVDKATTVAHKRVGKLL